MQTKLAHVSLADITVSETNKMFREEAELNEVALKDLTESILTHGVISPILLRPLDLPSGKSMYELVCGERRFRSSQYAQQKTIPAYIRELTNEEAFELQITENLERKDVHPLKEAFAYKHLMDKDPAVNTIAELAHKFAKTEHYISLRLKLNDLIPEAKKDYQAGKMTLGHALLIARLTPEDQKECIDECSDRGYYEAIHELEEFIERSIICNLSAVPFKKDDANLVPKAGPCTTCQFRSGANQLFADIDKKDRCFKPACFEQKTAAHLAIQVQEIIDTKPETIFLIDSEFKLQADLAKLLRDYKITPLKEYDDFTTYSYGGGKQIKGFYLSGRDAGTYKTVFSKKEKAVKSAKPSGDKNGKPSPAEIKQLISGIQARTERAAELDQEKVYVRVLEGLQKSEAFKKVGVAKLNRTDEIMMLYMIIDHAGYGLSNKLRTMFKLPERYMGRVDKAEAYIKALERLTNDETATLVRMIMLDKFAGQAPTASQPAGKLLIRAAREFGGVDVDAFEKEQAEERKKREARAAERIRSLKAEAKGTTKPAKKKKSEPVTA